MSQHSSELTLDDQPPEHFIVVSAPDKIDS